MTRRCFKVLDKNFVVVFIIVPVCSLTHGIDTMQEHFMKTIRAMNKLMISTYVTLRCILIQVGLHLQ